MELQLAGYRLTTAEIVYHMPDHPAVLQSFVWQHYDIAPRYPELRRFLDFWSENIEGKLHTVTVARKQLVGPSSTTRAAGLWNLH
ncbi:MAG: Usg family protein [Geminicoccaceae bacterium]|nr:Usg family protein [Geminicoccaceae bacterium]